MALYFSKTNGTFITIKLIDYKNIKPFMFNIID